MKKLLVCFLLVNSFALLMSQTLSTVPRGLRLIAPSHYAYGCAAAADGTVYFTEFNHQQLRQVNTNGTISLRRMDLPGLFGIAIDANNNMFVGRDLGDIGNPGKITKITQAGVETDIVTGITRPRQLTTDASGNVYFATESPSRISRWNQATGTVDILVSGLSYSAEGVAVASDGTIYFSEYGNPEGGVPGTVKKRATNGTITTLVNTGIWRCRGLVINSTNDYLYLCTEANQEDHGNSGLLAKIKISDGTWTKALEGIDYPQFPSVAGNGNIYFTLTRENWLAMYNPSASTTESSWTGNSNVKMGISEGTWASGGAGTLLNIKVGNELVFSGNIAASVTNGTVHGWIRIPENLITLDSSQLYNPCYPSEHPTPGIFRLPKVIYEASSGTCLIAIVALRDHVGQRWPMQYPGTCNESPAAGFSEKPLGYLVYFSWNNSNRIDTILSPSYTETGNTLHIIKGSEPGWIYRGAYAASSQTWLNAGKYDAAPRNYTWAEQDLGAFSGKSKYIYVMWHKNGPYRPNAAKVRLYDYTEEKSLVTVDQTKYADNLDHGDDRFSGWLLVGQKKVNITPSTKLRLYQDDPVGTTEYLQSDAILLSDYPIFDNTSLGSATDFENNPALSVTSSGSTGVGSHWGMQGLGYQYTSTNGKSFAANIDANVVTDLPYGNYYVEVSWDYLNTDNINVTNARYSVNGTQTSDIIDQNRSATNQGGSFVQGNSVGTWSGFYRLNGTFSHSSGTPLTVHSSYSASSYGSKRFVFDMVRFIPVDPTQYRTAIDNNTAIAVTDKRKFLVSNYPNPFKSVTTIRYSIPQDGKVFIKVFNSHGSEIATLETGYKVKGDYSVDFKKGMLKAGIYYYSVHVNGIVVSNKMIIL